LKGIESILELSFSQTILDKLVDCEKRKIGKEKKTKNKNFIRLEFWWIKLHLLSNASVKKIFF
jgi:hypothetical protein